jgi:phosphate-selective porin OprO/OprP
VIVLAASAHASDAPPAAAEPLPSAPVETAAVGNAGESFDWSVEWRGWDGLHFMAAQPTGAPDALTGRRFVDFERVQVRGRAGARIDADAASFGGPVFEGVPGGAELRRARINVRGDSQIILPLEFRLELSYVPTRLTLDEASLSWRGIQALGTLTFGQFKPPTGLELIDSSWNQIFMEPAAPLQAMLPGTEFGLRAVRPFAHERATWALSMHTGGAGTSEFGNTSLSDASSVAGRLTWLAIDEPGGALLHLGASANVQPRADAELQYRARPESRQAPFVIDTGPIDARRASTIGLETAWIDGPLSLQAEWLVTTVEPAGGSSLRFGGGYALVSWYLTGERRVYDRSNGAFSRLQPLRDFGFGPDGGPGAVELALRLSATDLTDGAVGGGRLLMGSAAVNWSLTTNLHAKLVLMAGRVSDTVNDGRLAAVQARFGVNF